MYKGTALPRRGGKTFFAIKQALKSGKPIAVFKESTKQRILDTAKIMGVEPPEIFVIAKNTSVPQNVSFSLIIIDYQEV